MQTPRGAARAFAPSWPPDDTEESVVGTNLHQLGITNLRAGINAVAAQQRTPDAPLPFKAIAQVGLGRAGRTSRSRQLTVSSWAAGGG